MKENFSALKKRHSVYHLSKDTGYSQDEIVELVGEALNLVPSAFNAQTQRLVVLFDERADKFWDLTLAELKKVTPVDAFEGTVNKINAFKNTQATILYYYDASVTRNLQESYALYAEHFPNWAREENGMLQISIWSELAELGIGASLQHYNPIVDDVVKKEFDIPEDWVLVGQMPLGKIETPGTDKEKADLDTKMKVFK